MNYVQQAQTFPAIWSDLVCSRKFEKLIALYHETSVLMPTFSPHTIRKLDDLKTYFKALSEREELSVRLHENTLTSQQVSEYDYILLGIYSWQFLVDDTLLTFPSRFTFVLDFANESPIMHHHSSQIPRTLS